jgi:hypothetical protein
MKPTNPAVPATTPGIRIRQEKPLNKLEQECFGLLGLYIPKHRIIPHGLTLRLANGLKYTPDFVCHGDRIQCVEVKGKHAWDDSIAKLKMAATAWPEFDFVLMWKDGHVYKTQPVKP